MQCISTARGTACFWKDFCGISNFSGAGEYETEQYKVVIVKDGKVPPPKFLEKEEVVGKDKPKSHESIYKYGFGQMFFGQFLK
jgi:hypothetical protein